MGEVLVHPGRKGFVEERAYLSNFYVVPGGILVGEWVVPTVEHAYQAAKCMNNEDLRLVLGAPTASRAKRLGQRVLVRPDWDLIKLGVMSAFVELKFSRKELADKLIVEPGPLVEWNYWHDNYWGICSCSECPGTGENWLGRILEITRSKIRAGIIPVR